jgi:hypothetical protein
LQFGTIFSRFTALAALVLCPTFGTSASLAAASNIRSAADYGLSTGPTFQSTGDKSDKDVRYTFTLVNGSSREIRVRIIKQSGQGLSLILPTRSILTRTIHSHQSISMTINLHVRNCSEVQNSTWPLTIDYSTNSINWQVVELAMTSAGDLQWQKFLANSVCR